MILNEIKHPLLNPDSKHYDADNPTGTTAIEDFENEYPLNELLSWAKINAHKYKKRLGKKDDIQKEYRKIKTYENYTYLLIDLQRAATKKGILHDPNTWTPKQYYDALGVKVRYEF